MQGVTTIRPQLGTVVFQKSDQAKPVQELHFGAADASDTGSWAKTLGMLGLATLPLFPMAAPTVANAQSSPVYSDEVPVIRGIGDARHIVDAIRRGIEAQDPQLMIQDLQRNPMLTPTDRQLIADAIARFNGGRLGQLAVTIIPGGTSDLPSLGVEIINGSGLGIRGQNNGILILVNAERVRADERTRRLGIYPGHGVKTVFNQDAAVNILRTHALPYLERGDHSGAIRATVEAVIRYAEANIRAEAPVTRTERPPERFTSPEPRVEVRPSGENDTTPMGTLLGLLALLSLAGAGYGGYRYMDWRGRVKQDMAEMNRVFETIGSSYRVSPGLFEAGNMYNATTLEKLLEKTPKSADVDPALLINTIEDVLAHTQYGERAKALEVILLHGLVHPVSEVRARSVQTLVSDGIDEAEYEVFKALLKEEASRKVIESLLEPMADVAKEADLPEFTEYLSHKDPGYRALGAKVMTRFPKADTMGRFIEALKTEAHDSVDKVLRAGILQLITPETVGQFEPYLGNDTPLGLRKTAIEAFAKSGSSAWFERVLAAFMDNTDRKVNKDFENALEATVADKHHDTVAGLLNDAKASKRVQQMALGLLGRLRRPESVDPLFAYLASPNTGYPQEATKLLLSLIGPSHESRVMDIITSHDPKNEDNDVMAAAVQAAAKFNKPEALKPLFEAYEKTGHDAHVNALVLEALENSPHTTQSQAFLEETMLTHPKSESRIAAALVLDDYGAKALPAFLNALEKTTAKTSSGEVDTLSKAILKIGRDEALLPTFVERANSRNERMNAVATGVVVNAIGNWRQNGGYDDKRVMKNLAELSRHQNKRVAQAAKNTRQQLAQDKADEIRRMGRNGNFSSSSVRSTIGNYRDSGDEIVRAAAVWALAELATRLAAYEAEEERRRQAAEAAARRRREEEAEAARRRRDDDSSSSSSWSSSSSSSSSGWGSSSGSDWGGGGGFSSGGGGDI